MSFLNRQAWSSPCPQITLLNRTLPPKDRHAGAGGMPGNVFH
ncbi:hypothetical protein [Amycolatopsis deserti]|nr:hypothetical protein [Amycolatopsis deserti]